MEIKRFDYDFSVCKVKDISAVDFSQEYCFIGKTDEELSVVCLTNRAPEETLERDDGWKAFRIQGVLDFSLIGILAEISTILTENKIGIFAISTYNIYLEYIRKGIDILTNLHKSGNLIIWHFLYNNTNKEKKISRFSSLFRIAV